MAELRMTLEFTLEGKRHDFYLRKIQISDDPGVGSAEWMHYIEAFLNEIRIAILPVRGRVKIEGVSNTKEEL